VNLPAYKAGHQKGNPELNLGELIPQTPRKKPFIPVHSTAKAGVHKYLKQLDSCFRRNDNEGKIRLFTKPSTLKLPNPIREIESPFSTHKIT